jgi:hypothetical protein
MGERKDLRISHSNHDEQDGLCSVIDRLSIVGYFSDFCRRLHVGVVILLKAEQSKLMDTLWRDIAMAGTLRQADILHRHAWYAHLAGCVLKQILETPMVLTTHSLEPQRPWKREQLGAGYHYYPKMWHRPYRPVSP